LTSSFLVSFMHRIIPLLTLILLSTQIWLPLSAQSVSPLSVEKIMRDPKWIGNSPSDIQWAEDGKTIYFHWNPEKNKADSLYAVGLNKSEPKKVEPAVRRALPAATGIYNRSFTQKVYEKNGDIFWLDIRSGNVRQVTRTVEAETSPSFSHDEQKVLYVYGDNLFAWNLITGTTSQLTQFKKGKKPESKESEQDKWLKADQLKRLEVLKERSDKKKQTEKQTKIDLMRPKEIYVEDKKVTTVVVSPDEHYIVYRLTNAPKGNKTALVPSYVTETGYTEDLPARTKVGNQTPVEELFVLDIRQDTVFQVSALSLPGIYDEPDYRKDYPKKAAGRSEGSKKDTTAGKTARKVHFGAPVWSEDGKRAVLAIRADDNKDRWLALLDVESHKLKSIDRYRDEAWVGGPGSLAFGWLTHNQIWLQSEASGYAHLYALDVESEQKKQLTKGKFEVSEVQFSKDKKQFYFLSNEVHPGEKHVYRLPATGGLPVRLTSGSGAYEYKLSPDEKYLALRFSASNRPWELYLMENKPGTQPKQLTHSLSEEFLSYEWRKPEVVSFKARDGAEVYGRLYQPENGRKNGAAVIFVHGAGYLQNAHKWWSQYFREYMFHNLLTDQGYTVLDIDYRGSAGYGHDWRTGIYRHMGGKDLTDHIDGARLLTEKYGIDTRRIGIYGGSYGGFITLMAMFTQPDVFAAGAALRSVTDWAHYNHGYTSNILNEPFTDSLAYVRSSPIYYAEGLKGHLLMCHGMIDVNVHFQDIVRLTQRLIELKKENWELAVYPMEDHAFVEPSSWTDEYKRILKLFGEKLSRPAQK